MKDLTRKQLKDVIEGRGSGIRIPNLCSFWLYPDAFGEKAGEVAAWKKEHVYDMDVLYLRMPDVAEAPASDPEYCWLPAGTAVTGTGAYDGVSAIRDWEDTAFVEEMYRKFPSPDSPLLYRDPDFVPDHGKYLAAQWFYCLFERHWSLRGMENALTDFYFYPDEVHRLYQHLTSFYIRAIERAKEEYDIDGVFTSDDIGMQTGPFFSLEIFREFFKPYYKQIIDRCHELGLHFWLHACGNIEPFLEDLIGIGLDVIHPIQKHTMDERKIAERYGGRICILAGFDVQKTIPYGTAEDVRAEARFLIDTYAREDGRFMITFGNGATPDWKMSSVEALYDEIANYRPERLGQWEDT